MLCLDTDSQMSLLGIKLLAPIRDLRYMVHAFLSETLEGGVLTFRSFSETDTWQNLRHQVTSEKIFAAFISVSHQILSPQRQKPPEP